MESDQIPEDPADALRDNLTTLDRDAGEAADAAAGYLLRRYVPAVVGLIVAAWFVHRFRGRRRRLASQLTTVAYVV